MKKKILAAALAMTMVLGGSVSALASDDRATVDENSITNGVYGAELEIESVVNTPTIELKVPTSFKVGINPYKMEYNADKPEDAAAEKSTNQIVCAEQTITNNSNVPVAVNVAELGATVATPSKAVLAAAAPTAAVKTKSVFLYLETKSAAKDDYDAFKPANKNVLVVPVTKTASKLNIMELDAKDGENAEMNFRFNGSVADSPSEVWTADDTIGLKVKFTFTPLVAPDTTA